MYYSTLLFTVRIQGLPIVFKSPLLSRERVKLKFCTHSHTIDQNLSGNVDVGVLRDSRKFSGHASRGHLCGSSAFLLFSLLTSRNQIIGISSCIIHVVCVNMQRVYSASAIPLKWLYAKQKSPVFSHFEETICGTATVRAYRKQKDFMEMCDCLTDISHQPWHQYLVCWR